MADLEKRFTGLSPEQRALLERRLKVKDLSSLRQSEAQTPGSRAASGAAEPSAALAGDRLAREMHFSLLFFSGNGSDEIADKYRLLVECARAADRLSLDAVWTPERHFHAFGGLYPNPSVLAAALAMITERIELRAGSVVMPLHDPLRVAEEWSVADNLSKGRVAIAFASGWSIDDFLLAPDAYDARKQVMVEGIQAVRTLWAGDSIARQDSKGNQREVRIFPKPIQPSLPIWLTSAGSLDTFVKAGELGAHVLTSLIGQTVEQLGEKIAAYRQSLAEHGFDPHAYRVALMLHTFIGTDLEVVKEQVRQPMYEYLRTNLGLHINQARRRNTDVDIEGFSGEDEDVLLGYAFERYFSTSSLLGTPSSCLAMIDRLRANDVDEVACLVDFGVDDDAVIAGLDHLHVLKERCNAGLVGAPAPRQGDALLVR